MTVIPFDPLASFYIDHPLFHVVPRMENSNLEDLSMAPLVLGDAAPSAGRPLEAFQDTEPRL